MDGERLRPSSPTRCFTSPGRPARGQRGASPGTQMGMPCRPRQHGAGDAKVIMMSRRASVDSAGLAQLGFKIPELLVGLPRHWPIGNSDQVRLELVMEKLDQIRPTD